MTATQTFTDANFDRDVIAAGKPVLVDFYADWCQPCHMIAPTVEALATEYEGSVVVGKVDVDANRVVSEKYGISSIPTLHLFKDGELVERFVGVTSKDTIARAIDRALEGAAA